MNIAIRVASVVKNGSRNYHRYKTKGIVDKSNIIRQKLHRKFQYCSCNCYITYFYCDILNGAKADKSWPRFPNNQLEGTLQGKLIRTSLSW